MGCIVISYLHHQQNMKLLRSVSSPNRGTGAERHFIQLFKNFTGLTPKKYRDLYSSSDWHVSGLNKRDTL